MLQFAKEYKKKIKYDFIINLYLISYTLYYSKFILDDSDDIKDI